MTLPAPESERWKPLRAGLVDMFYYDAEEFWFHDGRLLLRGNNGTGKSKVLALTLPFLLDGELAPHRVEPDGDRQKRMEWNLLLGGKHPASERLGYTWLEFGRVTADGTPEFRTIGCGLKAVSGRGIARHWFFVTTQRVGQDLILLPDTRVALTREKLREATDGHGMLYDRASDYRRAVDEALFGLGEHRYEALINLLIQLRQPQLSKKPDEKLLSRALTEALPPLSPGLVTTVAEAFRGLDEERDALRGLNEARQAAETFLGYYSRYAKTAAKRKAAGPRTAYSRHMHLSQDLAAAEEAFAAADAALTVARDELDALEARRVELDARREALNADPAMRDAERLTQMEDDARRREETARIRDRDAARQAGEARKREEKAEKAADKASEFRLAVDGALRTAAETARAARCADGHQAAVRDWEADISRARRDTEAVADRQAQAVTEAERLQAEAARRRRDLQAAQATEDRLAAEVQAASERLEQAETEATERMEALVSSYRAYLSGLSELRVGDPDELAASVEEWAETTDGPNPAVAVIDDAARAAGTALGRLEAELSARKAGHERRARELDEEITRLRSGGHDVPPVPHTRAAGVRDGRPGAPHPGAPHPGAPLWKVTDFAPGTADADRAGLEAALEAAGILDAWVTPDGTLVEGDTTIVSGLDPVPGPSAADVLAPAVNAEDEAAAGVREESVLSVLRAIGLGEVSGPGRTWVAPDGRWANGVLSGSWAKDSATYIGEGAREAARRERITRLTGELEAERAAADDDAAALAGVAERRETLAGEHRAVPSDAAVRESRTRAASERRRRADLRDQHTGAVRAREGKQGELDTALTAAAEFARDTGLPESPEELAGVKEAVGEYRVVIAGLWPSAQNAKDAAAAADEAATELADARVHADEAAEAAVTVREEAAAARATYEALRETAGAAVDELYRKLEAVRTAARERDAAERDTRGREQRALEDRGKAAGKRDQLTAEIAEATRARDEAVGQFRAFAATGLLTIALPDLEIPDTSEPWAATPAVALARAVNAGLEDTDDGDGPWDRIQKRVTDEHKTLSDSMTTHGHSAGLTLREGVIVVDVIFAGRSHDVPGLAAALGEEADERGRLLSAREREILENHLLNEVAGTLHELIATAEAEVAQMNGELSSRPTSTGMTLRLIWQQARNAPEGLDRVRGKLRQTIDAWSSGDRAAVGSFLQERINSEHAANPAAGWAEALTTALDYRGWHEFAIQRYSDGQWRPAVGPASGGERALVASVPLFAAASSHYKSAGNAFAPRLIALDEAFAGVDDDSRAKCLGLLSTFDMDVVMTSEREWGCYPEVPGLAICQLSRHDGLDAVLVTPWRWDGRERRRADLPEAATARANQPSLLS